MYDSIFPDGKITDGWKNMLYDDSPKTVQTFEKDGELYGLVAVCRCEDGIHIINSISKGNNTYTFAMQRMILEHTKANRKVVIMSTLRDSCIKKFTDSFVEDGEESYFMKGI